MAEENQNSKVENRLKELAEQIVLLIRKLNKKQQYVIIGTLFVVISFVAFLVVYNNADKTRGDDGFRILFSNLSPKDAGLIATQLDQQKIEYKIPKDGTIEVRKDIVNKVRMDIAALGLPKNSMVGFELFDKKEFGNTDFEQNIKFLRALEGELSRTITELKPVKQARVHIALPKESVFVSKELPPTASVTIEVAKDMKLNRKQIQGIRNLVASSVPKLVPQNVKITDENGELLGEEDELSVAGEIAKMQLKYKKNYEKIYEEKIINMLSPIIGGRDKVVAKVTIDFDFSKKKMHEEYFDPAVVPRSEQTMEEKREGFRPKEIGGVPGAVSNIGPVQGLQQNQLKEKYQKNQATTNYEVSKKISDIQGEYAIIKRVTAAVAVDGKYSYKQNGEEKKLVYQPRNKQEINAIELLVKQAIGYDAKRNDVVTVGSFEFRKEIDANRVELSPFELFLKKVEFMFGPIYPILKYLFLIVVLFVFYKKVLSPFSQKMLELKTEEEEPEKVELEFEEEEYEDEFERLSEVRKKIESQLGVGAEDEENIRYDVLLEKIKTMAEEHPEDIANVIQQLMTDELQKKGE